MGCIPSLHARRSRLYLGRGRSRADEFFGVVQTCNLTNNRRLILCPNLNTQCCEVCNLVANRLTSKTTLTKQSNRFAGFGSLVVGPPPVVSNVLNVGVGFEGLGLVGGKECLVAVDD